MTIDLILLTLVKGTVALGIPLAVLPLILHIERRGAGFIQKRVGPNRVGPFGLLQPLADVFKFLFKEEVEPQHVHPFFYKLAPILSLIMAILPLAGIPICAPIIVDSLTIHPEVFPSEMGIFYIFAAAALGSYGILLAGWGSNNKYTMLGAIRACAQMISYELAMSTTLVAIFIIYGTHDLHELVNRQSQTWFGVIYKWGIFTQPIGAILFMVGIFAESNRLPFDLAEGESELVAGYHLEYSSMKFALFFMAEYLHIIVLSCLFSFLFLGGYGPIPGMEYLLEMLLEKIPYIHYIFQFISLFIKVSLLVWFFVWVRWSIPRFRYDQLMKLGWLRLLPLGLLNLVITAVYVAVRDLI